MKRTSIKRKLIFLSISLIIIAGISIWYGVRVHQENERERELQAMALYASRMNFTVRDACPFDCAFRRFRVNRRRSDEVQFTEIVFVHSYEEAAQFGEYVLVAWPEENLYREGRILPIRGTPWIIEQLNEGLRNEFPDIDFRDYGLPENEITLIDVVDNWEIVERLTHYGTWQ